VSSLVLVVLLAFVAPVAAKPTPAQKCTSAKVKAAAKGVAATLACHAKAAGKGTSVDAACVAKAEGTARATTEPGRRGAGATPPRPAKRVHGAA
jgi:hypothetical protein